MLRQVKKRFRPLLALAFLSCAPLQASEPAAAEILRNARVLQAQQQAGFVGQLRNEDRVIPFRLFLESGVIRYVFGDRSLILRLGQKSARLEEQVGSSKSTVGPARFDKKVQDTDISYEDLSLRFLYWPNAALIGEESVLTQRCWRLQLQPASRNDSQYSRVDLWVEKKSGTLLRADSYDWNSEIAKRFEVRKVQQIDGLWVLKQMKIQELSAAGRDRTPTYLEIQGMLKPKGSQ